MHICLYQHTIVSTSPAGFASLEEEDTCTFVCINTQLYPHHPLGSRPLMPGGIFSVDAHGEGADARVLVCWQPVVNRHATQARVSTANGTTSSCACRQ